MRTAQPVAAPRARTGYHPPHRQRHPLPLRHCARGYRRCAVDEDWHALVAVAVDRHGQAIGPALRLSERTESVIRLRLAGA